MLDYIRYNQINEGFQILNLYFLLFKKKYPVDFDDKLKIGDVRYDYMTLNNN